MMTANTARKESRKNRARINADTRRAAHEWLEGTAGPAIEAAVESGANRVIVGMPVSAVDVVRQAIAEELDARGYTHSLSDDEAIISWEE